MLSSATITFDIADLVGNDFDARRTKAWVSTNIAEGVIADTVGNQVRVGDGLGTIAEDGTGSVSVWVPGAGSNPASWQTYIHFDYAQRRPGGARERLTFGPFTITTSANLADLIQEQEVPPTYLTQVTALLDGKVTAAQAAVIAAEAAAAEAADISNIAVPDAVVAALVKGTGGAGPLTRDALPAAVVAPGTDRTVWVSKAGSNSNTGLAPHNAFLTVGAAITALPNGGTIRVGWGTFDETGLNPADRTVLEGTSRLGTIIRLIANGTLLPLTNKVNCSFSRIGLTFATGISGTLLKLDNCFNNHFSDFTIYGTWAPDASAGTGQLGILLTGNAGDNTFTEFVVSNLAQGAQIDSQTNLFAGGKFSNCGVHFQGGDPTGATFSSGAELKGVVFNGVGDVFINLNGSSQTWIFDDVWCDGLADKGIVIGNADTGHGPALVSLSNIPILAAKTKCLEINAVAQIALGPIRFGAASGFTPTEMTINATGAPNGFAYALKSGQAFDISTTFPPGWTYFPRGAAPIGQLTANTVAFGGQATSGQASYIQNARSRFGYTGSGDVIASDAGGGRPVGLRSGAGGAARTSVRADPDGQGVIDGGFRVPVTSPGVFPYTVLITDVVVLVPTGTAKVVNLPSATTAKAGHQVFVKDSSGGGASFNITINANGSDTIDGATSRVVSTAFGSVRLVSNGSTAWYVI